MSVCGLPVAYRGADSNPFPSLNDCMTLKMLSHLPEQPLHSNPPHANRDTQGTCWVVVRTEMRWCPGGAPHRAGTLTAFCVGCGYTPVLCPKRVKFTARPVDVYVLSLPSRNQGCLIHFDGLVARSRLLPAPLSVRGGAKLPTVVPRPQTRLCSQQPLHSCLTDRKKRVNS